MASYAALCWRRCRSPVGWFKVGEIKLYGPDLIHQVIEKNFHPNWNLSTWYSMYLCFGNVLETLLGSSLSKIYKLRRDRHVRKLRTKDVASVKVLWRNRNMKEMTWEAEEEMKSKYPYLFQIEDNEDVGGKHDIMEAETAL
ncbi:uncharacterized protein [Nicotiana tomentosiformis]|uniref:uncharacterized protein n=1 Tax=Nicotiana tomentosiformis TaxID=4098 RepID=UPI00388CBB4A